MALVKSALKASLLALYNDMRLDEYTEDEFAGAMADIVDAYIKTAVVTITGTASGVTSGGATAPVAGTGSLS